MEYSFYFYANPFQPSSLDAAQALECALKKRGARVYALPWLCEKGVGQPADEKMLPASVRAVVAFGGDGTLLRIAARASRQNLPLLGVHTGTVGFLMPGDAGNPEETAALLMQEHYPLRCQPMLDVTWGSHHYLALNDVSLTRGEHPGVVETKVLADGETVFRARGDGAVISTPLGATAYAMAAGGPIVRPDTPCLLAAPLCARELLLRPVVLPLTASITLQAWGHQRRRLQLAIDGQLLFPIEDELQVEIALSSVQARLITPPTNHGFFHTLRVKQLNWNKDEEQE